MTQKLHRQCNQRSIRTAETGLSNDPTAQRYPRGLLLHPLYYSSEVRAVSEYGQDQEMLVQTGEIQLAEQFNRQLTGKFDPEACKDEYEGRVTKLIETKEAGQATTKQAPRRTVAPVIDLMDVLKRASRRIPRRLL
jgi:non-homologous end joining protein Ku